MYVQEDTFLHIRRTYSYINETQTPLGIYIMAMRLRRAINSLWIYDVVSRSVCFHRKPTFIAHQTKCLPNTLCYTIYNTVILYYTLTYCAGMTLKFCYRLRTPVV